MTVGEDNQCHSDLHVNQASGSSLPLVDAAIYDVPVDPSAPNNVHAMTLRFVGANKRVLEIGCAAGHVTSALVGQGNTVVGVDIDPAAAEKAAAHAERVVVGDVESMDLDAELSGDRFDVAVLGDVLEHLRAPVSVLRSVRRLLGPKGFVVISLPNVAHVDLRLMLLSGRWEYRDIGLMDHSHLRFFTRASARELVTAAGFSATHIDRVVVPAFATELGVDRSAAPADLVAEILQDPDAETYQFVIKAVRDDADAATSAALARSAEAEDALLRANHKLALAHDELTQRDQESTALRAELSELHARLPELEEDSRALHELMQSRSMRLVEPLRRVVRALGRLFFVNP
jgi:2-polyprenyl-3-methyl-5-hydroxy-6-metoxy-1,4-benzoquinol methylase